MYSRSRRTQSLKSVTLLRPLICQRQVKPGLTLKRRRCARSSNRRTSSTGSGRGPTRLISPRRTFQSWGNSSKLYRRRNRPNRVTRGSLVTLKTGPSISLSTASSCLSCSALVTIERNLYIVNGFPFNPLRNWRNKIGPGELNRIAIPNANMNGAARASAKKAPTLSMNPLALLATKQPARNGIPGSGGHTIRQASSGRSEF